MNESDLQRNYNHTINPTDSEIYSDKRFVIIDNGFQGGTQWIYFIVIDNKSFSFHLFGGQPDKFLLNQLPEPISYHIYKIQDMNSKLCGSFCLYFFYLLERVYYYDTFLKIYILVKNSLSCMYSSLIVLIVYVKSQL